MNIGQSSKAPVVALLLTAALWSTGCKNNVVYREQGWDDYRQEDYAAALEDFQKAVDLKPSDYQSQYYLGVTHLKLDRPVPAQTALEQALTLKPNDPEWTPRIADSLAEAYFQQDRVETLYAFLDNMIATYNQQPYDYMRKAEFLGKLGDADGQKEALDKAAYFALPGDATPYLAQAEFYLTANDVPRAIQALKHGYWADPQSEEVKNQLRGLGVVPGPSIAVKPPKAEILD